MPPLTLVLDDHLAQHHRHAKQVRPRNGVLEARERRLGSERIAVDGIAPDEHLVNGVSSEPGRIVAVGVAASDREEPLPDQFRKLVSNLAALPLVTNAT